MIMRVLTLLGALTWLNIAAAAPIEKPPTEKRDLSSDDISVLQLAHYLENLEFSFYTGGYNAFTDAEYIAAGFPEGFRNNIGVIASQEATHRDLLASVLMDAGVEALPACTYSFPYSSPTTFVDLGNMITSVGIGAYLGGALDLVDNSTLLTSASSILTNEARHDAYLRTGIGASPFPTPYDTSLTAIWAYNLAHMFVVSCPTELPLTLLPMLNLTSPMPPANLQPPTATGTVLMFAWNPSTFFVAVDPTAPLYIAFINQVTAPVFEQITMTGTGTGTVSVPVGVTGVAFAVLTTFSSLPTTSDISTFGTLAGPAEVVLS